jgi:hypothetical protein
MADSYCTVGDCERPTREGRRLCEAHEKRLQRGQPLTAPLAERLSPKERLLEAARRWVESDAEDDGEYERNERAVLRAAKAFGPAATGAIIREALAEARARGVRLGRPPKVDTGEAQAMVERLGTVQLAAAALGVSRDAVRRALERGAKSSISRRAGKGASRRETPVFAPRAVASAR